MESEINREDEFLEESQEGGQVPSGVQALGNLDGANTFILSSATANPLTKTSLTVVRQAVNRFNTEFYSKINSLPNFTLADGTSIKNRPLFLSDLLDLKNAVSDISKVFNDIPIAQFKHLPDPRFLNSSGTTIGGQYDLSSNLMDETPLEQPLEQPVEQPVETPEVMPSLEVEEPTISGGYSKSKSHKWSSHKKRRHTRIRTKKNKKL